MSIEFNGKEDYIEIPDECFDGEWHNVSVFVDVKTDKPYQMIIYLDGKEKK